LTWPRLTFARPINHKTQPFIWKNMTKPSRLNGFDKLQARLPSLRTAFGAFKALFPPCLLFFLIYNFFAIEDSTWQLWLLDAEAVIGGLGFVILSLFYRLKNNLKEQYGPKAFELAFTRIALPALAILFSIAARVGYIPGPPIPRFAGYPALPALGGLRVLLGAALWVRAAATFGVDYLTMLYVYHPRESQVVDRAIYGIIRHPIYAGGLWIVFGLALLNGTWFGPVLAVFFLLGVWGWLWLVEEKELIERFGPSYAEYRKQTPAFLPRPGQVPAFFRFLFTGQ
jgi:protein-S-isoprenylcysteine O-methyltransferase Ste14